MSPGEDVDVRVRIRNTGARPGREVVQVYASRPDSGVERPARWLAGFAAIDVDAGDVAGVAVTIRARVLQHWEPARGWATEPGSFTVEAGRSVADLRCTTRVSVRAAGTVSTFADDCPHAH